MKRLCCLFVCLCTLPVFSQTFSNQQYREDFDYFWNTINNNYCYFDKKGVDWPGLKPFFKQHIDTVTTRNAFVGILEKAFNELYDHHSSLRTNTKYSRRLVPTSTDLWAAYDDNQPIVTEVRKGFGAEKSGIRAGMQIIAVNDVNVDEAILPFLAHAVNSESKSFALRLLLAGDHVAPRKITLKTAKGLQDFFPDSDGMMLENISYPEMVQSSTVEDIGYIKINNFLYSNKLVSKFDSVLNSLIQKKALIIDLRETASGGNTTVARAILGRFIDKEQFYQKHELYAEERETGVKRSWTEMVSPRGKTYTKPVVILVDHWTGSVAEAITIAFDGMKRATVIGTQMARLNGAVESFQMPHTKIGFSFGTEKLFHVNGQPRELYNPTITVDVSQQQPDQDLILKTALHYLNQKLK